MVASWFRSSPARIELEVPSVPVEHPQRPALLPISSYEVIKLLEQRDIVDLTESVLQNGSFPCYGRDSDMIWIAVRIASPQKNSILITGSPGVGKTRFYYHMARLIVENKAPPGLQGRRIFLLTNNNNAKTVLTILDQHFSKQCVLVSDEVHAIRHREAWMGMAVKDQSEELKPYIGSGKTPFIGFTDRPEGFLKDNAWRRRFHVKNLEEMSIGDAIEALKASKEFLQEKITKDHSEKFEIRVEITDEAIALAVKLSVIYLPQEFLPDKPSKILEPAAVGKVHQFMGKPVDADSLITVSSNIHEHGKPPVVQVTGEDVYRCVEQEYRVTRKEVEQQLSALESAMEYSPIPMTEPLMKYTTNLNERVRRKAVLPAYGRAEELKKVVMTLSAVEANNVILRGYAGCGKSRIGEGLAYNIVHHLVPAWLENVQVLVLDLNSLIGDTKYRGELETKFKDFLKSAEKYSDHFILMIDEAHRLVGAGTSEHSPEDAANQFKELLGRGKLRVLGMTTPHEYYHLERDPAFLRRFQTQDIEPFSPTQTIEVMKADKEYLEHQYSKRMKSPFKIDLSACEAAAHLGVRYWPKEYLPSSGYKILHSACAFAEVNAPAGQPVIVNDETVIDYVNYYFRKGQAKARRLVEQDLVQLKAELHPSNQLIPLHEPLMRFTENWTNLARQGLFKPTVHQEAALQSVLQTLKCKTINNVLLIGRAGSGKTSLAQQTAIFMAGDSKNERLFLSLKLQDILEEARKSPRFITDLIDSLRRYAGSYVLFVDEFHNFFRIQTQDGIPLFELFKPVLAEGKVRLIGATTPEEAAIYIFDKGEAVLRRFSHQFTPELTDQQSVDALTASKETYEAHFAQQYGSPFVIDPAAFPIAVQEAKTRVTHQALPASAITLFEGACSAKGAENSSEAVKISPNDIVWYAKARYPLHSWHSRIYQFFAKWFRYFFVRTNI